MISEVVETRTLTLQQHCYLNVQSTTAEKLVGQEAEGTEYTAAALFLLPAKPCYPK
jgi:hypothetical protein